MAEDISFDTYLPDTTTLTQEELIIARERVEESIKKAWT